MYILSCYSYTLNNFYTCFKPAPIINATKFDFLAKWPLIKFELNF